MSKLNPSGSALVYSTMLGGSGLDACAGLAIDSSGNAYVGGTTSSSDFPTHNPMQNSLRGTTNAFAAKINAAGSDLMYSTFLGGSSLDSGSSVALYSIRRALYIAGSAASFDFPVSAGPHRPH